MSAPAYLPEVDVNGTNQPVDPAGIPQATKDDGFLEVQSVPNTWWNWLFKSIYDWFVYLVADRHRVLHKEHNGGSTAISASPLTLMSYTVPADTLDDKVLRGRATISCSGVAVPTAMTLTVEFDGQVIATVDKPAGAAITDNVTVDFQIETPALGGSVNCHSSWQGVYEQPAGPTYTASGAGKTLAVVDTTDDIDIDVRVSGVVDPGNLVIAENFVVELLGKV